MDTSERQAKLNTEVRFHNYKNALPLAYALKLELELIDKRTAKQDEQLENVTLQIRQLERLTEPVYQKWGRVIWHKWVDPDADEELPPLAAEPESVLTASEEEEQ
jgi:hypothetical protein